MTDFDSALSQLDAFIDNYMQSANTAGLSLGLTDRQSLLGVKTYGYADVAAKKPVTPGMLFEIGSISKSFTSIVVMHMYEAGQLDLFSPVTSYLPWFNVRSSGEPITIHHLLSHTSGLINGMDFTGEARYEVLAATHTQASPPGAHFHYSNLGYKALGVILEDLLGQTYQETIRNLILVPLGMQATDPVISHETREKLAIGYQSIYDDRPDNSKYPLAPATWLETNTADGCIASNAEDMAKYVRMLLNGGQSGVLSKDGFNLMSRPVIDAWDGYKYGYGLTITEIDGFRHIGHGGGMVGYISSMLADMDNGFGVIVLSNAPRETFEVADYSLKCLRSVKLNKPLPSLPSVSHPIPIEEAEAYTGVFRSGGEKLTFATEKDKLVLHYKDARIPLEPRGQHYFYADHPDLERYLLHFGTESDQIVEVFHGAHWYTNNKYTGIADFDLPIDWKAYTGHYRCHNPWYSNFRVVARKGALILLWPSGEELKLVTQGAGTFRVGEEQFSPECIRFGTVVNGQALRVNLSGCNYYRTFTP
jgi:D-alanyl-D-alanine carboxypeptidase